MAKSNWQLHVEKWGRGCGSDLCGRAQKVCLARGSLPCDVLFVAEAPGESENVVGRPMVGPAGVHFEQFVIRRALAPGVRWAVANVLGCMPTDEAGLKCEFPKDDDDLILRCGERLTELVRLAEPRLIVCVGTHANAWLGPKSVGMKAAVKTHRLCSVCRRPQASSPAGRTCPNGHAGVPGVDIPRVHVEHPAAVLRKSVSQQGLDWQRCEVVVRNAAEDVAAQEVR